MSIIIGETPSTGNDYKETAKDLCRALLEDEKLKGVFTSIDAFMENDVSKELFSQMQTKSEELQNKQQAGIELTAGEVEEYNKLREKMLDDPAAKAFVEAQESIQSVHQTIGSWVSLVFENGRMPTEEEFEGHCGPG
ncbi:MAG: YlbF family regulator [Verrucomicrobiaceae bacterium]|nr:YlbF family regulator [Verrucomicrobiaceae bacterium]